MNINRSLGEEDSTPHGGLCSAQDSEKEQMWKESEEQENWSEKQSEKAGWTAAASGENLNR